MVDEAEVGALVERAPNGGPTTRNTETPVDEPLVDAARTTRAPGSRIDPDAVLGAVLRQARLAAGLTCERAGVASGLSPTRIAGIEDGDGLLLFADALPLARAYRQSLREIARRFERDVRAAQGAEA